MIKRTLVAMTLMGSAAVAGPYVNIENNGSWTKEDFTGSQTDLHIGYENKIGEFDWFVQGGPMLDNPDNADSSTDFSGKVGGSIPASENLDIYGEFSFISSDENSYGSKLGAKYNF